MNLLIEKVRVFVKQMSKDLWKALRNNMRDFEGRNYINGEWRATPEMYTKINPATGLTMKKGGMIDYRKKGMFYGGGMARRGR